MTAAPAIARVDPLDVLRLRAECRGFLWWAGEIDSIPEAVDPLWEFAERSGLVDELGADRVQQILVEAFAPYREAEL